MHIGLTLTHTELKIDGISVVDPGSNGERTSEHSKREMTSLVGLLEDKLFDLGEKYARDFNRLLFGDGVADPKGIAGLKLLVADNPTTGTVGGIDRATVTWWRSRAYTAAMGTAVGTTPALGAWGGAPIASNPANGGALAQVLQAERRKLTQFGGEPDLMIAGSAFIGALETEIRANGNYTMNGFKGTQDAAMGQMNFAGSEIVYDPTLDDLGLSKRMYWIDTKRIMLMCMEDEWMHKHTPSRPYDKFVMFRSITSTCQLIAKGLNSSGVYDIA
jgi:hypothetical protein